MTLEFQDTKIIKNKTEEIFYRGKKENTSKITEYIYTIYNCLGKTSPEVHFYTNPNDIHNGITKDKVIMDESQITEKLQKSWATSLFSGGNEVLEKFRDTRVHITEPEEVYKKLNIHYTQIIKLPILHNNFYSHHFFSFYEYVRELSKDEFFNTYLDFLLAGVMWYQFNEGHAHVLYTPVAIRTDLEGNLHSDNPLRPAVEWATGDPQCFLWGVPFELELWDNIVNKRITPKECMRIKNVEQRSKALRVVGYESLIKPEYLIDTEYKTCNLIKKNGKVEKVTTKYDMYSVPGIYDDVPNLRRKVNTTLVHYKCPSTGREYFTTVPSKFTHPLDAMAWKFQMSREDYIKMDLET